MWIATLSDTRASAKGEMLQETTIGIIGLHSLPNSHGGYEQYFSYITDNPSFKKFAKRNRVVFYCDNNYTDVPDDIHFKAIFPNKGESGSCYYIRAIGMAARECDVIYCCGTGASIGLLLSQATLIWRRVKVAVNVDGEEYKRTKYNFGQRLLILALHYLAMILADTIILDSRSLDGRLPFTKVMRKKLEYIPYFFPDRLIRERKVAPEYKPCDGLPGKPFDLVVARLVPENNIEMIVRAKIKGEISIPLVIVGSTDTEYGRLLKKKYQDRVFFAGGIYDQDKLNSVRRNCRHYLHGHSVGGTNPSLIEALGMCASIFSFDTPYNREVAGTSARYFSSVSELESLLLSNIRVTNDLNTQIKQYSESAAVLSFIKVLKGKS